MTISTTNTENSFPGIPDGIVKDFDFTFQIQNKDQTEVLIDGILQDPSAYTILLNTNQETAPGGVLSFVSAPAVATVPKIRRATVPTQDVAFAQESRLNTKGLESALDKLMLLIQEVKQQSQGVEGPPGPQGIQGLPGNLLGPVSSTDGSLALWDGASGTTLKDGVPPGSEGDILKTVGGAWTATSSAAAVLPSGTIVMWDTNMAAVPTGWAAMDGSNVTINTIVRTTVDTRGKYVLAAAVADAGSSGYAGATVRPGTIAGTKTHQHANGGAVAIGGTVATGTVGPLTNIGGSNSGVGFVAFPTTYNLNINSHSHSAAISGNTQASSEATRPIEVALLLIIKVDE